MNSSEKYKLFEEERIKKEKLGNLLLQKYLSNYNELIN